MLIYVCDGYPLLKSKHIWWIFGWCSLLFTVWKDMVHNVLYAMSILWSLL